MAQSEVGRKDRVGAWRDVGRTLRSARGERGIIRRILRLFPYVQSLGHDNRRLIIQREMNALAVRSYESTVRVLEKERTFTESLERDSVERLRLHSGRDRFQELEAPFEDCRRNCGIVVRRCRVGDEMGRRGVQKQLGAGLLGKLAGRG